MFRIPSDVASHLQRGGTLLVPTSQRLRAVQLAHAAAEMEASRGVWASVDVQTPSRWARRECERLAESAPDAWPRLLTPAEEWLLWREATREAARGYSFLDSGLVAVRREGKFAYHTADYAALRALTDFLWEDCCKKGKPGGKSCC